jgi:hypothetical protein
MKQAATELRGPIARPFGATPEIAQSKNRLWKPRLVRRDMKHDTSWTWIRMKQAKGSMKIIVIPTSRLSSGGLLPR